MLPSHQQPCKEHLPRTCSNRPGRDRFAARVVQCPTALPANARATACDCSPTAATLTPQLNTHSHTPTPLLRLQAQCAQLSEPAPTLASVHSATCCDKERVRLSLALPLGRPPFNPNARSATMRPSPGEVASASKCASSESATTRCCTRCQITGCDRALSVAHPWCCRQLARAPGLPQAGAIRNAMQ